MWLTRGCGRLLFSVDWEPGDDGQVVVRVQGELDLATEDRLRDALTVVLLQEPRAIVVDLAGVSFLDCAGVRALLEAHRGATSRGMTLAVRNPNPMVRCVLQIVDAAAPLGLPSASFHREDLYGYGEAR